MSDDVKKRLDDLEKRVKYLENKILTPLNDPRKDGLLLEEAKKIVIQYDKASSSLIQRRLGIGFARAATIPVSTSFSGKQLFLNISSITIATTIVWSSLVWV